MGIPAITDITGNHDRSQLEERARYSDTTGTGRIAFFFHMITRLSVLCILLIITAPFVSCSTHNARDIAARYSDSVVLIGNMYYLKTTDEDGETTYIGRDFTGTDITHSRDKQRLIPFITFGTGFFISQTGLIVTNRHVAYPWKTKIADLQELITREENEEKTITHEQIFTGIISNGSLVDISTQDNLVSVSNKIAQTFYQCDVLTHHPDENVDLALIQMQARTLPPQTTYIQKSDIAKHSHRYNKGEDIFMIGFPGGLTFATTRTALYKQIENTVSNGIISKISDKYNIQYTLSTGDGSSGSPIFDHSGKVIAINYAVNDIQGALMNYGIKAGYIHDIIEKLETTPLKTKLAKILARILLLFIPIALYNIHRLIREDIIEKKHVFLPLLKLSVYSLLSVAIIIMNCIIV